MTETTARQRELSNDNGDDDADELESRDSREWDLSDSSQQHVSLIRPMDLIAPPTTSRFPSGFMPLDKIPPPMKPSSSSARYVETSLDDLSFSSEASSTNGADEGNSSPPLAPLSTFNLKAVVMHADSIPINVTGTYRLMINWWH